MKEKEMFGSLYASLRELGVGDMEAELYVVSLKLGPSLISEVAKHLGISRPNVYKVIRSLEEHGLVRYSDREKYSRSFMVEPPSTVLEALRMRKRELSEVDEGLVAEMPDLLAYYHQGGGATRIKVLQGREQYVKIFKQSVEEEHAEILFCGSAEDFIRFVSWDIEKEWIRRRVKRGVSIKVLTLPGEIPDTLVSRDAREMRETRILRVENPFRSSFMLYGNKMVIWQPEAPLAVLVEDVYIVRMMKELFSMLWTVSSSS
ncbi:MAG: helix-turn-helix domain-containing protein [Candidatus Moranbacteria bacterium]|nr:helix-turn-helix domain-containing protein [Candidatus Moranbacteria bacterium]